MSNSKILAEVAKLTKKYNPCGIRIVNGKATCNHVERPEPCCTGCSHLKKTGCSVAAPACRFWFCRYAWARFPFLAQIKLYVLIFRYTGELRWRHDQEPVEKLRALNHNVPQFNDDYRRQQLLKQKSDPQSIGFFRV